MAKQPETQDHYRIHADNIQFEGLGVVLAALARLGIINVTYELVTDILAYKVPSRVFEIDAIDLARTFIKQHCRKTIADGAVADIEIVDFRMLSNGRKPTNRTQPYAPLSPCALSLKRLDGFTVAIAFFG